MDDYGVKPDEMIWVSGMDQKASAGADQVNQLADMVAGTRQSKPKLELMLESGEIDALVSVQTPRAMARNEGIVRCLFENCREVEEDYFRRTGIFPMMHTIVIKREVYEQNPWIAQSLFDAFDEAKRRAMTNIYETNALSVVAPFIVHEIERTRALMGMDYWPFGIDATKKCITTFFRHLKEQGIIDREPTVTDLFLDVRPSALEAAAG